MALLASALIRSARDRHPAFDPHQHPDPVLLRALSRQQREWAAKAVRENPTVFRAEAVLDLATYDFQLGFALPASLDVQGGDVVLQSGATVALSRTAWENRHESTRAYRYHLSGGGLFLSGGPNDWRDVQEVRVRYAPVPDNLTAPSDTLALPDNAEAMCVSFLADFIAGRTPPEAAVPAASLRAERDQAEAAWLREVRNQYRAKTFRVQAVC